MMDYRGKGKSSSTMMRREIGHTFFQSLLLLLQLLLGLHLSPGIAILKRHLDARRGKQDARDGDTIVGGKEVVDEGRGWSSWGCRRRVVRGHPRVYQITL